MPDRINRGQIKSRIHIGQLGYLFKTHHFTYTKNKIFELKKIIIKTSGSKIKKTVIIKII